MGIFEGIGVACCALAIYWLPPFILSFIADADVDDMVFWTAFLGCIFFVAVILLWATGEPFPVK